MELKAGTSLQGEKYRIERTLGYGGFAITYLAEQVLASRMVCIKEFFPKSYYNRENDKLHISLGSVGSREMMDAYKKKFLTEARTIAQLDHPNIIHILDIFEENGTVYYVMDYINGGTLFDSVRSHGPMDEASALDLTIKVASALVYIHERKIAHLDIKPSNIMVRKLDNRPILIDFGLSKQYDVEGHQLSSTPVGISHGFAPIEQYQSGGVRDFSPKPDIYSLGATLYCILSGSVPPLAADLLNTGLPTIKGVSERTMAVIGKAMSVSTKGRYDSAAEMLEALNGALIELRDSASAGDKNDKQAEQNANDTFVDMATMPTDPPKEEVRWPNNRSVSAGVEPTLPAEEATHIIGEDVDVETVPTVEPEVKPAPKPVKPCVEAVKKSTAERKSGGSLMWLWILLTVLVIGGVCVYFYMTKLQPEPEPVPEEVIDPTIPNRIDDEEWESMRSAGTEVVEVAEDVADDETVVSEESEVAVEDGADIDVVPEAISEPVFTLTSSSSVSVAGSLTHGQITYTLENPVDGLSVDVTDKPDWIYVSYDEGVVRYSVYANNSSSSRSGTMTVSYGDQSFTVSFTQSPGDTSPNVIPDSEYNATYRGGSTDRNSY